jgi:hypothetical protein
MNEAQIGKLQGLMRVVYEDRFAMHGDHPGDDKGFLFKLVEPSKRGRKVAATARSREFGVGKSRKGKGFSHTIVQDERRVFLLLPPQAAITSRL